MAERYLMDTSAVIKYLNQTFSSKAIRFIDKIIDESCNISFISEIELQSWQPPNVDDLNVYKQFITVSTIFSIDKNITATTIEIRKKYKIKIADAIIAATALTNSFTLIADNDKDFLKVANLKYLNPRNAIVI
ncbi:MAG: PIN domain-containing protein [Bacteroidetes bacterium]|nr:PIN domain-containing protein [Bacteroidota bacterium]MBS1671106.1 PIN domain-containing protein [Bacteroidota bacterium]